MSPEASGRRRLTTPVGAGEGALGPEVHASPGIAALFASLEGQGAHRILDLGPAVGKNLEFFARFGRTVRVADLWRAPQAAAAPPGATTPAERLAAILPAGDGPYQIVLAWDLLNYLDGAETRAVISRLVDVSEEGARLFAIVVESREMSERPLRFEIVDGGHLGYRTATGSTRQSPRLAPAEVERRIAPFRVERSIVLRHGVREYVAALPREPW